MSPHDDQDDLSIEDVIAFLVTVAFYKIVVLGFMIFLVWVMS